MEPLQYGQILEIKSPGSSMKTYHGFYKHPDPILDNIIIQKRVMSKSKGKEKVDEHWIIEKDPPGYLGYHASGEFTETKIIEDNDKTDKKSSKKTK